MNKKELALKCVEALKKEYPDAICSLTARTPLQLLIATRLSAQCTDARVNLVTPALFESYPTLDAFCEADREDVEKLIHSCGFYHGKARDIIGMCRMIRSDFGGEVPDNIDDLIKLPGVGRKTANLIVGDVYKKPAVVTDTHLIRISNRIGLVNTKDPKKVEFELKKYFRQRRAMIFATELFCTAERSVPRDVRCAINVVFPNFVKRKSDLKA